MQYHRIELTINKDGTITEKVLGVTGPDCTEITKGLESAIGEVLRQELLPEYIQQPLTEQENEQENETQFYS